MCIQLPMLYTGKEKFIVGEGGGGGVYYRRGWRN